MEEEIVKTLETPIGKIFILKQDRDATEVEKLNFYKTMAALVDTIK